MSMPTISSFPALLDVSNDNSSSLPEHFTLPSNESGIVTRPISGVRCPTCASKGQEVWVIPGKACGYCGTACG